MTVGGVSISVTTPPESGALEVRPVERADLLAIHRIERSSFDNPWPYEAFERYVDANGFLVGVDPEASISSDPIDNAPVVGFVVGTVTPNHGQDFGHIKDLAVHPDTRRNGIGRTLLQASIDRLAAEGARTVKLEVRASNDPAMRLYHEEGFDPFRRHPAYYDNGEDAIVMIREL